MDVLTASEARLGGRSHGVVPCMTSFGFHRCGDRTADGRPARSSSPPDGVTLTSWAPRRPTGHPLCGEYLPAAFFPSPHFEYSLLFRFSKIKLFRSENKSTVGYKNKCVLCNQLNTLVTHICVGFCVLLLGVHCTLSKIEYPTISFHIALVQFLRNKLRSSRSVVAGYDHQCSPFFWSRKILPHRLLSY